MEVLCNISRWQSWHCVPKDIGTDAILIIKVFWYWVPNVNPNISVNRLKTANITEDLPYLSPTYTNPMVKLTSVHNAILIIKVFWYWVRNVNPNISVYRLKTANITEDLPYTNPMVKLTLVHNAILTIQLYHHQLPSLTKYPRLN